MKCTKIVLLILFLLMIESCGKPKKGTYAAHFDFDSKPAPGFVYHYSHSLNVSISKTTHDSIFFVYSDSHYDHSTLAKNKKAVSGKYFTNLGFSSQYFYFKPLQMSGTWRVDDGVYYIEGHFTTTHNAIDGGTYGPDVADTGTFVFQRTGK